jgi:hypothetical protein
VRVGVRLRKRLLPRAGVPACTIRKDIPVCLFGLVLKKRKSFIWIFPDVSLVTGCSTPDSGADVTAPLGPCADGCHNFFYGSPYISSYIYAIGRNVGLGRSNSVTATNGDMTCMMGQVLASPGSHRRGFNALKLYKLGFLQPVTLATGASTPFLSSLYNYEFDTAGIVKLLKLPDGEIYLSFRSAREWSVDRSNNFGSKYMSFGSTINGATHVHTRNSDGSTTLVKVILNGQSYAVPNSAFSVRQDWSTKDGAQLSITSTGTFPTALVQPVVTAPLAGTAVWNSGLQDTSEQSSTSIGCYGGSAVLNINWAGDDRNSSVFMRLQVNVPVNSNIVSATLLLEADVDQLQYQQGTTQTIIAAEQTLNPQAYSGNVKARPYFARVATAFSGDYYVADEIAINLQTQVQQVVSQVGWVAGNYMSLTIVSAVLNQQLTRTAQSGYACGLIGGLTLCGPRLRVVYTSGSGGLPAPINCMFTWSAWSVCSNSLNQCGAAGTQDRNLLVTTQPANGGTACPSPTRQTQDCTTAPCIVPVKVTKEYIYNLFDSVCLID